jgi:hypothetical protein
MRKASSKELRSALQEEEALELKFTASTGSGTIRGHS